MAQLKIGILTFHFSDNYGALLQAYALAKWLAEQGHDVEFIDYHPRHVEEGGDFQRLWDPKRLRPNLKIAYLRLSRAQQMLFGNKAMAAKFDAFRHNILRVADKKLRSHAEVEAHLRAMQRPYDLIVLGSDQIWAASQQYGLDPVYFADFDVPAGTRRIGYAPSFGRASVDPSDTAALRRMLLGLDGVSVREQSGAALAAELIGKPVPSVPDPTILLSDFSALAATPTQFTGHVFCYALRSGQGIREVAEGIAGAANAQILSPYNPHRRWREIGRTVYPSPLEWVSLLHHASFVVTNSFHGTALSILLQRPFVVVSLPDSRRGMNERALNLLKSVGLRHRFVECGDLDAAGHLFEESIDWSATQARVDALSESGRAYLRDNLARAAREEKPQVVHQHN
jgi:hypothetical protein